MISKQEQQQLLSLLQNPSWGIVDKMANELCDRIRYEVTVGADQWETVRDTLINEGQVRGIQRFIKGLYNYVSHEQ